MICIKHLFDPVEAQDGERIWIEPGGLTHDLKDICQITHIMSTLGPSAELAAVFEQHPNCFDFFEDQYLEELRSSAYLTSMRGLAAASVHQTFTLIYLGDNSKENCAVVLHRFLSELLQHSLQKA
jgi:uncharacterized protein YeaO (DUF488 family)